LACVPYDGPVRGDRPLQRWREQRDFAAVVPAKHHAAFLDGAGQATSSDLVETFKTDDWMLVVVRPRVEHGWRERRSALLSRLVELDKGQARALTRWSALK
jgi:hypothetical protein